MTRMTRAAKVKSLETEVAVDGRRMRSDANRRKIADAMIELARRGEIDPSADMVAERAGVGRRTVFRLFSDMDGLYGEMHAIMVQRLEPIFTAPIEGPSWRERLDRLIERRSRLFEEMLPVKTAADVRRYNSPFLQEKHAYITRMLREILLFVLPKAKAEDATLFEALDLSLSFEAWRRLRQEQNLSAKAATAIFKHIAAKLVD